jgi:hypothetical protein
MVSSTITIPEIRRFKIRLEHGNTIEEPIENLQTIEEYTRIYGRGVINKITFYFRPSRSYNYTQKVTLRRCEPNDRFRFEFRNQDIQKNVFDYVAVVNKINTTTNLADILGKYIINPFQIEQHNIMMPFQYID